MINWLSRRLNTCHRYQFKGYTVLNFLKTGWTCLGEQLCTPEYYENTTASWRSTFMTSHRKDNGILLAISYLCLPQQQIAFTAMTECGKRQRGRIKKIRRSTFQEDLKVKRVSWIGVHRVASDRSRWRSLVYCWRRPMLQLKREELSK